MTRETINTHAAAMQRLRWPIGVLLGLLWLPLLAAPAFNTAPARAALIRLLPEWQAQITLVALPKDGPDRFRISGRPGHIVVAGTTPAVILTGVEAYLTRVAHVGIGWPGNSLSRLPAILPAPPKPITSHAVVPNRYALNDTDDGYANAYMDWNAWQHKVDLLALHGFNEVFVPIGTAAVYRTTFRQFGYSAAELAAWIPAPGHQPWFLLGNLTGFDAAAMTPALYARRVALARRIVARLRALGMTPVLPGYFGLVPPGFAAKHPGAHVVAQGLWNGFRRPDWLDPRSPEFARIAATFYRTQRALFGATSMYRMSLMQEGGRFGNVPPGAAAHAVMAALQRAHPGARWVMLGWQKNPQPAVLAALDHRRVLILDGLSERYAGLDREKSWDGTPYAFGSIRNFGGHSTLGANTGVWLQRFPAWLHKPGSALRGIAWLPEASGNDPASFALFAALAWTPVPHDAARWFAAYARSRYGGVDPRAAAAWRILAATAYAMPAGKWSEPQDSLFDARPGLDVGTAATWSPRAMRYDARRFNGALCQLLRVRPALRATSAYHYDLVDVARQALSNHARVLLPEIRAAYEAKDAARLHQLTQTWLGDMRLLNRLLASNPHFLLGDWLAPARTAAAGNAGEAARLEYDQRSLITVWGPRAAADAGGLHDYANRQLAGLVSGYYLPRWQRFFASLEQSLATGKPRAPIDWYALGHAWAASTATAATVPQGNAWKLAGEVAQRLCVCQP
ncbi:MAG TPA: alpha-N-acetylglucosaminidase TIM-barrel domain-containing protein [Rhodanobacteraceae bacterium]